MAISFRWPAIAGLCFLGSLIFCVASLSQSSLEQLAGRSVAIQLVKADDLSPVQGSFGALRLTAAPAQITKQTTLYATLQANGVVPDTEAFCLVYDLNPALRNIRDVKAGAVVQVPKIEGGHDLANKLGKDYLVALTVDPELRQALDQGIDELQTTASRFAALPPDRFPSPADAGPIQQNVAALAKWYSQIEKSYARRTGPPLRRQTLLQLKSEVDAMNSLLDPRAGSDQKITKSDQEQIEAIYRDIESVMMNYGQVLANQAPAAEALYKVVINIKGDDAGLIERLRVYYTFNGIYRDPPISPPVTSYPFPQLGSGKSEVLPVKNYRVWAAQDGDPGHPLTPPLLVQVSPLAGDTQEFDLSLIKGNR